MERRPLRFLIAGGGTGGHLYPALAIAEELRSLEPSAEFLFVGTKDKIEARVVPQRGFAFATIWISGLHRRLTPENILFPLKVLVALIQSFFLVRKFRPDAVLGTGGYVCGPVLYTGAMLNVPTFVHESNSQPGVTTTLVASRAAKVFVAFEDTKLRLRRSDNVVLVGTPTRRELDSGSRNEAASFFGMDVAAKTVFVFGGSLGAESVNTAMLALADKLRQKNTQVIWQTGATDFDRIRSKVQNSKGLWVGPYIDSMELAYAAADVVICRAGATTIAELTRLGKPAILVPYPFAADDHQTKNARSLVTAGAALMIRDSEVKQQLEDELHALLNDTARLAAMSAASRKLGKPNAGTQIAQQILSTIR